MPTALARRVVPGLIVCAYALCVLALAAAWAQTGDTAPPPAPTEDGVLVEVYRAIVSGRWSWLAGFALIVVIEPIKRWLMGVGIFAGEVKDLADAKPRHPILRTDLGGLVLAFAVAAVTGVGSALLAGAEWNGTLATGILRNAVVAVGGYTTIKRLILEQFAAGSKVVASLPRPAAVAERA